MISGEIDDNVYFQCIGISSHGCGCYGEDGMASQNILHISGLCGTFLVEMSTCSSISTSTGTSPYLEEHYGFTHEHASDDCQMIIEAVAHMCKLDKQVAENIVCKLVIDARKDGNVSLRYVDSLYLASPFTPMMEIKQFYYLFAK